MAWLANLDTRAKHWPKPARWAYVGFKWYLIALGGFMVIRLWLDRIGLWSLY
jgi:hypothetical protein